MAKSFTSPVIVRIASIRLAQITLLTAFRQSFDKKQAVLKCSGTVFTVIERELSRWAPKVPFGGQIVILWNEPAPYQRVLAALREKRE